MARVHYLFFDGYIAVMPLYTFDLFYVIGHLPLFYLLIENLDKIILNSKLETSKYF